MEPHAVQDGQPGRPEEGRRLGTRDEGTDALEVGEEALMTS